MGAAIVVGMGMASTLFFLTVSLYGFFGSNPTLAEILQRLDVLFSLYDAYLIHERMIID
jgi:hypothetical protein